MVFNQTKGSARLTPRPPHTPSSARLGSPGAAAAGAGPRSDPDLRAATPAARSGVRAQRHRASPRRAARTTVRTRGAGGRGSGGSQRSQHLKSESGGNGTDGAETEAGGEQVASGRRHARRTGRVGGGEKFLLNFPTRSRRGRGAAAPPGAGGRAPGPTLPGRGRPPPPAGPRPVLTCPPVVLAWVAAPGAPRVGRRRRAEARPTGPSPSFHLLVPAPGGSDDSAVDPRLVTPGGGNSRAPAPRPPAPSPLRAPPAPLPAPPLGGGGAGAAATCARPPATGTRAAPPGLPRPRPSGADTEPGGPPTCPAAGLPGGESESRIRPNMAAGSEADSRGGAGGVKGRLGARGQPAAPEPEPGAQSPSVPPPRRSPGPRPGV